MSDYPTSSIRAGDRVNTPDGDGVVLEREFRRWPDASRWGSHAGDSVRVELDDGTAPWYPVERVLPSGSVVR